MFFFLGNLYSRKLPETVGGVKGLCSEYVSRLWGHLHVKENRVWFHSLEVEEFRDLPRKDKVESSTNIQQVSFLFFKSCLHQRCGWSFSSITKIGLTLLKLKVS